MNNIAAYIIYIVLAIIITVYVGRDLHRNGYFLILDLFDNHKFTVVVNNLLLTGYYLVNLGYVALEISSFPQIYSLEIGMTALATKVGTILLILGFLHFNNIVVLHLLSTRKQQFVNLFNT